MSSTAVVSSLASLPLPQAEVTGALIGAWLFGRSERTIRAYRQDLDEFRAFVGVADFESAAAALLNRPLGEANALALAYRGHLLRRALSPATVNRRLAALRSLARTFGIVTWSLEVENVRAKAYRDTRGPGRQGYYQLLGALAGRKGPKAVRDRAMVRLLYDRALRRAEVVALDLEDVDLEAGTLQVLGKGNRQKEPLTIPRPAVEALRSWIKVRGTEPGPLFTNFDRAGKGQRLTGTSLYRMVRRLGDDAGVKARPHGLRHAAITEALDRTNGNVRAVRSFSRHSKVETLMVYDDNRTDVGGEIAALVADAA